MNLKFVCERKKVSESSRVCGDSVCLHCTTPFCIFACARGCVSPLPLPKAVLASAHLCVLAQVMDVLGEQVNLLLM